MRLLIYVVPIVLALYALIDCALNEAPTTSKLPKAAWLLLILVIPVFGPLAWFLVSRFVDPSSVRPQPRPRPAWPHSRPVRAPDDDPEFLWRLEQQSRRARRERQRQESESSEEPEEPSET